MTTQAPLPPPALDALARGDKIEAIKQMRRATGLGLKEAMEAVEAHARGASIEAPGLRVNGREFAVPQAAAEALQRGELLEAIKLIRNANPTGPKQAKDAVDALRNSPPSRTVSGTQPTASKLQPRIPTVVEGDGAGGRGWLVLIVLLVVAAWWFTAGNSPP